MLEKPRLGIHTSRWAYTRFGPHNISNNKHITLFGNEDERFGRKKMCEKRENVGD